MLTENRSAPSICHRAEANAGNQQCRSPLACPGHDGGPAERIDSLGIRRRTISAPAIVKNSRGP
jgi:hypothetical protein